MIVEYKITIKGDYHVPEAIVDGHYGDVDIALGCEAEMIVDDPTDFLLYLANLDDADVKIKLTPVGE